MFLGFSLVKQLDILFDVTVSYNYNHYLRFPSFQKYYLH